MRYHFWNKEHHVSYKAAQVSKAVYSTGSSLEADMTSTLDHEEIIDALLDMLGFDKEQLGLELEEEGVMKEY